MGAHRAVLFLCRVQVDRGRVRVTMHECTKLGLYSRLYMRFSPLPCLVSFHSLFSFTGAAQSTISWVLLSESDFKTADQHWAVYHNFTSPSHFLSSVSTHLSVLYQLVSASRLGTTWLPTRWCHLLTTSSNALLMMWMLMSAKSSAPFPGANNLVPLGLLGTKAQFIQNSFQVMKY